MLIAIAALVSSTPAGFAAEKVPAAPGDRVRLLVYDERPLTGRLLAFDATSVTIATEPDSTPRVLSRDAIAGIDAERMKTRAGRSAAIGFLAGGTAGILLQRGDDGEPATGFITGALVGVTAGALLGKRSSTPEWKEATLPGDTGLRSTSPSGATFATSAYAATALPPGARVRVTMLPEAAADDSTLLRAGVAPGSRLVGDYLSSDAHAIELRDAQGRPRMIPQDVVALFETSRGTKSNGGKGALIGLVAGIASGVVVGIVLADVEDVDEDDAGAVPVALGLGGGVVGAGLGALVGSVARTERWDIVWSTKQEERR